MIITSRVIIFCTLLSICSTSSLMANALPFKGGDILFTYENSVYEMTQDGTIVGSMEVPRPSGTRYQLGGLAVDRTGRFWVYDLGGAGTTKFYLDYFSSYSPTSGTWSYLQVPSEGPDNLSDQDLTISGDYLYCNTHRVNVLTGALSDDTSIFSRETAEIATGLDGYLYATSRIGFQDRSKVRKYDPDTLELLSEITLCNADSEPLNIRGIAVNTVGELFVADWIPGAVYHFTASGNLLDAFDIKMTQLSDIHLFDDDLLVIGARSVELTNVNLTSSEIAFSATGFPKPLYTAFIPVPEPSSGILILSLLAFLLCNHLSRRKPYPKQ